MKIRLLGEPSIIDGRGHPQEVRGHQAWALLARLLLARAPQDRRSLAAELFPDTIDPLGSLRWSLAALRKALDSSESFRGDPVDANLPEGSIVDVWLIDTTDFDVEAAGVLLGGLEPRCSSEFSTWLLVERQRLGSLVDARLRRDTINALSTADHDRAIRLAEIGVRRNPFDEGMHVLLVKSLAMAGAYVTALEHVEAAEKMFLLELGEKPSNALRSAARRTVSSPAAGVSPVVFVNSLIQSGKAALSAGAIDAGIDCLRRAVTDSEKISDRHLQCRTMLELGTALVHSIRGYDDEGSVLLRQALELARQCGVAGMAAAALRELGYIEALAGRRPSAAVYLSEASNLAEDKEAHTGVHGAIGFNLVDWGKVGEGLEHYETALDYCRSTGNRRREIWSLGLGARGLLAAGRPADAEAWLSECLRLIEGQRWIAFRPWPVALLAESRLMQNAAPQEVRPMLEESFALSCQLEDPCWEGAVSRALALADAAEGNLPSAMEWLKEASKRCMRDINRYVALQVDILASQAKISRNQRQFEQANTIAREWIALAARAHMDSHVARAAKFIAEVG